MPQTSVTTDHQSAFRDDLISWFRRVRRPLPWREDRDPYRVWVSEIMLQQTRVDQAVPYFQRFIERFPDVEALADAPLDDVLLSWEGLGYYSRARNLHRAAQVVMEEHAGYVPDSRESLLELPGVGAYTSAAIASIAYQKPHAVVDGNVIRVLSRVFRIEHESRSGAMRRTAQQLGDALLPPEAPGEFNEAMMELGATVCTPSSPDCPACPLAPVCRARIDGVQAEYPRSKPRRAVPHYDIAAAIIMDGGRVLIQQRPQEGLLGGLWEFPGGKREEHETLEDACRREVNEETGLEVEISRLFCTVDHAYSHFRITLHVFLCSIAAGRVRADDTQRRLWVDPDRLDEFAFPRANRHVIDVLQKESLETPTER